MPDIWNQHDNHQQVNIVKPFKLDDYTWMIFTDGSHNNYGSRVECVLIKQSRQKNKKLIRFGFAASNIEAKFETTIFAMKTS